VGTCTGKLHLLSLAKEPESFWLFVTLVQAKRLPNGSGKLNTFPTLSSEFLLHRFLLKALLMLCHILHLILDDENAKHLNTGTSLNP
jgi:hypothetical protein